MTGSEQPLNEFLHDLLADSRPMSAAEQADVFWASAQQAARDREQRIRERDQLLARYDASLVDELAAKIGEAWDAFSEDEPPSHRELMREFAIAALEAFHNHHDESEDRQTNTPTEASDDNQTIGGRGHEHE